MNLAEFTKLKQEVESLKRQEAKAQGGMDQLQSQLRSIKIEQADLEAEKRRLQSPQDVLDRAAKELGMQPAEQRDFARLNGK